MTVGELVDKLNELQVSRDTEVRIAATGGFRHGKAVTAVTIGFDWDRGSIILHPVMPLTTVVRKKSNQQGDQT